MLLFLSLPALPAGYQLWQICPEALGRSGRGGCTSIDTERISSMPVIEQELEVIVAFQQMSC